MLTPPQLDTETRQFRHDFRVPYRLRCTPSRFANQIDAHAMTLNPIPSHPSSLSYVLKLHRDSQPAQGQISGLLEHVGTGQSILFSSADALIAALLAHAATDAAQSYRKAP